MRVGDFKCSEQQVTSLISSCLARKWDLMGHGSVWRVAGQIQRWQESSSKEKGRRKTRHRYMLLCSHSLTAHLQLMLLSVLFRLLINEKFICSSLRWYFSWSAMKKTNCVGFSSLRLYSTSLCNDYFLVVGISHLFLIYSLFWLLIQH